MPYNCQEFYDRVKKHPDAIVMDVGEAHPFIIHESHALVTLKDGSKVTKVLYVTFEFVNKHLKKLKACPCSSCQNAVAAYRFNKKALRRGATPEEMEALIPDSWEKEVLQ